MGTLLLKIAWPSVKRSELTDIATLPSLQAHEPEAAYVFIPRTGAYLNVGKELQMTAAGHRLLLDTDKLHGVLRTEENVVFYHLRRST